MASPPDPLEELVAEMREFNFRLDTNLKAIATAINALNERITALDNRLLAQEGTVTDHHAQLLGKAFMYMTHG